ncbi:hypothetical protein [Catellatospora bangladeshensis]|nr:hypothetical protein [Catellatospora bangladeshensis]
MRASRVAPASLLNIFAVVGVGDGDGSLTREVDICKAALLYADHVTIASPRIFGVVAAMGIVAVTPQTFKRVMSQAVRHGGNTMRDSAETVRVFGDALDAFPPRHELTPRQRQEKAQLTREIDRGMDALRHTARNNLSGQGADPLIAAVQEGLLTLDPLVHEDESFDELPADILLTRYVDVIRSSLGAASGYPLFDDDTGHLARLGLDEGFFVRSDAGRVRGAEAAVGTGLWGYLPGFPHADMSEIIDIRRTLDGPLGRFRAAVHGLASGVDISAEDPGFAEVLDQKWLYEVKPALDEIDERIRQDASLLSLAGRVARGAFEPLRTAAAGAGLGGLTIAAGPAKWIAAAAGLAVAGVAPVLQASHERRTAINEIERAQYYFLYRADRRMRGRQARPTWSS